MSALRLRYKAIQVAGSACCPPYIAAASDPVPPARHDVRWSMGKSSALIVALCLATTLSVVYLRAAWTLTLYGDDWAHLAQGLNQPPASLPSTWPVDYRPFDELLWILEAHIFGAHVFLYYLTLILLSLPAAYMGFAIVRRMTRSALIAAAVAFLWSVYPADLSHMWLSAIAYRLGGLALMCAVSLLYGQKPAGSRRRLMALCAAAACLSCNEVFLGLVGCLPLLAAWRSAAWGWPRRLWHAAPFAALVVVYVLYRLWLGPHVLHLPDNGRGPGTIRFGLAQQSAFWYAAAIAAGPGALQAAGHYIGLNASLSTVTDITVVLLCFAIALPILGRQSRNADEMRLGTRMIAAGGICVVAGFVPLCVTPNLPMFYDGLGRENAAATFGAALLAIGIIWVLVNAVAWPSSVARVVASSLAAAFILLAAHAQAGAAGQFNQFLSVQKTVWQRVIALAPAPVPRTTIQLTASDPSSIAILRGFDGFNVGLQLMNPSATDLRGVLAYDDSPSSLCAEAAKPTVVLLQLVTRPRLAVVPYIPQPEPGAAPCLSKAHLARLRTGPAEHTQWRDLVGG